ncbi:helix-turn-helix domain-containing protein [Pseudoflavitalea sp. X16]|uniref:helix-turn-helix domain-containing protein n=1 Tax=Paraflavitalea devenefica TaxID=2716334 RepID=UPI00142485E9|nr:helix-turn-helix domain-containing protein [Paraflavitalea devenefica]NII27913.1 helix-turn-helix domain-containing protein [Paraflavitalea devenefica]
MYPTTHGKAARKDVEIVLDLLNRAYPVSDALREEFYTHLVSLQLAKGDTLVEEGDRCHYMYFILEGALMGHATHKGKKITTYISVENEFVSSISGLYGLQPTREGIVAIEPTRLVALANEVMLALFEKHFDFNYIFRVFVQKYYQDAQERAHIIRVGNAKERFLYFMQTNPGYIDRLPLENAASLLDIKPHTLAKIRRQHTLSVQKSAGTERLCRQLEKYLRESQAYTEKNISLASLAAALEITTHKLSSLLNSHYQLNFVDFINTYRINHIKEQMVLPENMQSYTIEALAYDAGFSSRSAFYSSFKKLTGKSPVEYAQGFGR